MFPWFDRIDNAFIGKKRGQNAAHPAVTIYQERGSRIDGFATSSGMSDNTDWEMESRGRPARCLDYIYSLFHAPWGFRKIEDKFGMYPGRDFFQRFPSIDKTYPDIIDIDDSGEFIQFRDGVLRQYIKPAGWMSRTIQSFH